METNLYDQPAQARFINTYVPIDFGELYRIGSAQKQVVDEARKELSTNLQKWSEFQSLSDPDTSRYYDLTINKLSPMIEEMASNPDLIKTAEYRSKLQSAINSIDYAELSRLKKNAQNFDQRAKIIAQMRAEGLYNEDWDDIDMRNWDTSKKGIMEELSPVRYMTANQLSNPYFDNLKPGSLGSKFVDGIKYNVTGNNYQDLLAVAKAHYNDLINTPQGKKYYEQFLKNNNGNEQAAAEQFTDMIAQSQIDRTLRPKLDVDPVWLQMVKSSRSGSGQQEIIRPQPTRLDFINDSVYKNTSSNLGARFGGYKQYLSSLIDKYPNTDIAKNAAKGLKGVEDKQKEYEDSGILSQLYMQKYKQTGNDQDYINAIIFDNRSKQAQDQLIGQASKYILKSEFERRAGFNPVNVNNTNFSTKGYLEGVKSSLDLIKSNIALTDNDPLLTGVGGQQFEIQDENGSKHKIYQFESSNGFILPETAFQLATETKPRTIKRGAGLLRSGDFPLKELIESGNIGSVQFKPDNKMIKLGKNTLISGRIRIPKDEIEKYISTGILPSYLSGVAKSSLPGNPLNLSVQSINSSIKDLFQGRKVTEKVGEDGVDYYEIEAFRTLPASDVAPEYWQRVNQEWQGGSTGIGGSSQAKETYMDSADQLLGN